MVSSKVSFRTSMFPVSGVRNRIKNLGNISLNAALGAVFNGFLQVLGSLFALYRLPSPEFGSRVQVCSPLINPET